GHDRKPAQRDPLVLSESTTGGRTRCSPEFTVGDSSRTASRRGPCRSNALVTTSAQGAEEDRVGGRGAGGVGACGRGARAVPSGSAAAAMSRRAVCTGSWPTLLPRRSKETDPEAA